MKNTATKQANNCTKTGEFENLFLYQKHSKLRVLNLPAHSKIPISPSRVITAKTPIKIKKAFDRKLPTLVWVMKINKDIEPKIQKKDLPINAFII